MERLPATPRPDWREHVERDLGFVFHTIDGASYWDETAFYRFTSAEIDGIEAATAEIEQMALALVAQVVETGDEAYERLRIPRAAWDAIQGSWQAGEKNLYGRFDFCYGGTEPPKLLEYNADTPTALFEAAVVQWDWLEAVSPGRDQFNSIHERLIDAWRKFGLGRERLYFSSVKNHTEDGGTIEYLRDTAVQAGLETERIDIEDIGWDGSNFVDLGNRRIGALFKLYPWEWLVTEEFGPPLLSGAARVIEPAWKMVLSNKAALALLWEMAPGHPNLLPASLEPGGIEGKRVRKPIYSREGSNVQVQEAGGGVVTETGGGYGAEGFIYQTFAPMPEFDGNYPVIGSWVVASEPAGMGIREDSTAITRDTSRFIPHYFE
ncbi:MAG: glutathionylspermidine synthase family protein [Alphaproteobacteria bacterium]|nr:glutathionylspermidine synthase family protein [Alphaproteobacteria bacterium]